MANYPQLDDLVGVWKLKDVNDAVMGGYWRGSRALVMGGFTPGQLVESYNFQTKGTPTVFGNLTFSGQTYYQASLGSFTRAINAGGDNSPAATDVIDYGTFATEGNFADFGNLTAARLYVKGASNSVRGVTGGGSTGSNSNIIDYITIAATSNAVDFGDLTTARNRISSTGSPTRAIFGGGITPSQQNVIDFVEISTTGNAADFGDLVRTGNQFQQGSVSSSTRGIFAGGFNPSLSDEIQFITMASQGNAVDFGDLVGTYGLRLHAGASNSVKGVFFAGYNGSPGYVNYIQDFTIASGGTAVDVGSNTFNNGAAAGTSNSHGGLNNGYEGTRVRPLNEAGGDVGMFAGGSPDLELIQTINISSTGNANKFGDLSTGRRQFAGGFSNKTRSLTANGYDGGSPGYPAVIEYVEFATQGNSANFGDSSTGSETGGSMATNTRGVYSIGVANGSSIVNTVEYVTFGSLGNATDFGNATVARNNPAGLSSNTRGVLGGGANPSLDDVIDYITISTTGNSTDFGNLTVARKGLASSGSSTRGVFLGGASPNTSTANDTIDYITIASTGNATDFGNLVTAKRGLHGSVASNSVRGCVGAGATPSTTDVIEFITIASTGNASDFGDLMVSTNNVAASANGHGGLVGG